MKFWLGVTDRGWYERLRSYSPDEVKTSVTECAADHQSAATF